LLTLLQVPEQPLYFGDPTHSDDVISGQRKTKASATNHRRSRRIVNSAAEHIRSENGETVNDNVEQQAQDRTVSSASHDTALRSTSRTAQANVTNNIADASSRAGSSTRNSVLKVNVSFSSMHNRLS
jgi:hypothetical protein